MSVVAYFTRGEWNGWQGIPDYVDDMVCLWRDEDAPDEDVLPRVVRHDPDTGVWPEDVAPLPAIPFRHYQRDEERAGGWVLIEEGESVDIGHSTIIVRRVERDVQAIQLGILSSASKVRGSYTRPRRRK